MSNRKSIIGNVREEAKPKGMTTVLAIGTANPPNVYYQSDYPEWYFKVTHCWEGDDIEGLKRKFEWIYKRSDIRKRHMVIDEAMLMAEKTRNMTTFDEGSSLEGRLEIGKREIPKLAKEACERAIQDWGRGLSDITHLVFDCSLGGTMPGTDCALMKMLGLNSNVRRSMFYLQGCYTGGAVLRHAKDIAESNNGSRVLVVCSYINSFMFRGPNADYIDNLVGQSLFGDGAAALIVGCGPFLGGVERGLYEVYHCTQTLIDCGDRESPVRVFLGEMGLLLRLDHDLPEIICSNLGAIVDDTLKECGVTVDRKEEMFWVGHPGGRGILDAIEKEMGLSKECLETSRHVLSEYGNLSNACALFVLDETRKRSLTQSNQSTGLGKEWGLFLGFGLGVTVEVLVLRSLPLNQ